MSEPVKVTLRAGGGGSVWVGEHDISDAVQAINIVGTPHGSRVQLELAVLITTVDGEPTIGLPARTEQALLALGWTPPAPQGDDTRRAEP